MLKIMNYKVILAIALLTCGTAATLTLGALPRGQEAARTVADGVYTEAQADRGVQLVVRLRLPELPWNSTRGGSGGAASISRRAICQRVEWANA